MSNKKSPLRNIERKLPQLLSFLMPFCIVSVVFIVAEVYPFGDRQILASDGWHQYYPFLLTLRNKLLTGGSLEYIRNIGFGSNYLSLYAYYLASPLNLLSVLVPLDYMREFFTLLTVLKLSFAGLFFYYFLRIAYKKSECSMSFFALMYALCSWAAGYYWNIMWLDAFALLPLLLAGMVALLRDGRFRLYILALALSLWCNYYIAFFSCIFVFLSFFGYCIASWNGIGNFFRRFLRIGVCTLLGVGLAAVLLIPTLLAMQTTYSAKTSDVALLSMNLPKRVTPDTILQGYWQAFKKDVLPNLLPALQAVTSRLLPAYEPTSMEGLPNVFCGFTAVILSVFFFCNGKIKLREKIVTLFLLLFLMLSFVFRILDYIWHGFHFPNMLPYRFSFLVPFVLICTAYRAFSLMENFKYWKLAIILPVSALFGVSAYYKGDMGTQVILASAIVLVSTLFFFVFHGQKVKTRNIRANYARMFLCCIILCEMVLSFALGIDKVGTSSHDNYPKNGSYVEALLDYAHSIDSEPYYRTEVTETQTLNDGALNQYYGLSVFNSSANVNFNRFSRTMGLASWPGSNRYAYYESSPFGNTMAGLKYLIDRNGDHLSDQNQFAAAAGNVKLLKNKNYLGLGFMTDPALGSFVARAAQNNALLDQEEMFAAATGVSFNGMQNRLYRHLEHSELRADEGCSLSKSASRTSFYYKKPAEKNTANFTISYEVKEAGLMLAYLHLQGGDNVTVYRNSLDLFSRPSKVRTLYCIGDVEVGDVIDFTFKAKTYDSGSITLDVAMQNTGIFNMGMDNLSDEVWELTEAEDTYLCGSIDVKQDGLFYSSIPYEPGWTAYVDGQEVPIAQSYDPSAEDVLLTDAVISFPLSAGSHVIEMKYRAPGLNLGLLISGGSLLIFVLLWVLLRKNPVLWPDVIPPKPVEEVLPEPWDDLEDLLTFPDFEELDPPDAEEAPIEAPEEEEGEA